MRMPLVTGLLIAAVWLGPAEGISHAHDSLAPAGASHNWLPEERWVSRHWIPFDKQALKAALGLQRRDLHAYLYNDHRALATLARARGISASALADRLVAPWRGISEAQRALLRERTLRILTQGHLAQHMFFHVFHGAALHRVSSELLGMDTQTYRAHREHGQLSYVEIAARGGVPPERLTAGLMELFNLDRREGVERFEAWPAESARILSRRTAWLQCWLNQPPPGDDPANPYGKNRFLHGTHAATWPATARERAADAARVERFRRSLPPSCWPIPPRWSWSAQSNSVSSPRSPPPAPAAIGATSRTSTDPSPSSSIAQHQAP